MGDVEGRTQPEPENEKKKTKKIIRLVTVAAYLTLVSTAATMLSLYYLFFWNPTVQMGAERLVDPIQFHLSQLYSNVTRKESWTNMDSNFFSFDDYDSIGFDLDCTIVDYNVEELLKLVYNLLAKYLIQTKSYDSKFLLKSFEEDEFFLQKGLFMDLKRGNIFKLGENGEVLKAIHGTKCLSDEKLVDQYGGGNFINIIKEFVKNPLSIINSPHEKILRSTLDCFDMACILLFARIVDSLDEKNGEIMTEYNIWPDILAGLWKLYSRNNFATGESEFFTALKENPSLYFKKLSAEKLMWLKEVKSKKFVFLITGSFIDFASMSASYCIGEDWQDYFDVIVCYARKPFFFSAEKPFLNVKNAEEMDQPKEGLQVNTVYSQGNWQELKNLISKQTNVKDPKCLYIGDNLIQDVFAAVHFKCCHSVAISLELKDKFKSSKFWGSYFGVDNKTTYWNHLIRSYAVICVSSLDVFSKRPFNFLYNRLKPAGANELNETNGYYID